MLNIQCTSCAAIVVVKGAEAYQEGVYEVVCACENRIKVVIREKLLSTGVLTAQSR